MGKREGRRTVINANYRIVSASEYGVTLSHANDIDSAKQISEAIDGRIQCYIYGIGWVPWSDSMGQRKVIQQLKTKEGPKW